MTVFNSNHSHFLLANRLSKPVSFTGYRMESNGQARLFLPGHTQSVDSLQAKVMTAQGSSYDLPMKNKGVYWESEATVPAGSAYQFVYQMGNRQYVADVDHLQERQIEQSSFKVISADEATSPQIAVNIADIFQDSVVSPDKLAAILEKRNRQDLAQSVRNHFNLFGGNDAGLNAVMPTLKQAGFSGMLLKPFIGGDNLSSHHYWTIDPYVLNNTFPTKQAFGNFMKNALSSGMKVFSDGAFVNLGLNSPQMMSNVYHRYRSPYWDWFLYQQPEVGKNTAKDFPTEAHEKHRIGRLPQFLNPRTNRMETNYDRIDVRVVNDPVASEYNPNKPIYVEFYDTLVQTPDGAARPGYPMMVTNDDSIPLYRERVSASELKQKRAQIEKTTDLVDQKRLWVEWSHFALTDPSQDGMPIKWDGQIDVTLLNMRNPEVQDYMAGAVGYWTDYVRSFYTREIVDTLKLAQAKNPSGTALNWLEAITQSKEAPEALLPPIRFPRVETVDAGILQQTRQRLMENVHGENLSLSLVQQLRTQYPLQALALPNHFKATLSHPKLKKELAEEKLPFWAQMLGEIISPVVRPFRIIRHFDYFCHQVQELLRPRAFDDLLSRQLNQVIAELEPQQVERLKLRDVSGILADGLAERIYLECLTGQTSTDPAAIEAGFYATVPSYVHLSDPETGKNLLKGFLKQRLKTLNWGAIKQQLQSDLNQLDPELVSAAQAVMEKREIGMNWRMDAAKDVGLMDRVRNIPRQSERDKAFSEEMSFVESFWRNLSGRIRKAFPKSSIIAELTSFEALASRDVAAQWFRKLLGNGIFTSTPNMKFMYDTPMQLVHFAPKPHEFGASQMSVQQFQQTLSRMAKDVPSHALKHYQSLTSSHDYPNTTHVMLINPALGSQDYLNWWGLKDDFLVACKEFLTKPGFENERISLKSKGIPNLENTLEVLIQFVNSPQFQNKLSPEVRAFYSELEKKRQGTQGQDEWAGPTPTELKAQFVKQVFDCIPPADLSIPNRFSAKEELMEALSQRMTEPSMAKAMRGVLTNATQRINWAQVATRLNISESETRVIQNAFLPVFYTGMTQAIKKFGAQFGYQPLEIALENTMALIPVGWGDNLIPGASSDRLEAVLKEGIFEEAIKPVLDKLLRVMAIQVASPGNPSVYLPDLFAQSGSELIKNMYVQNRNVIDYSFIEPKGAPANRQFDRPYLRTFMKQASAILKWRTETPAIRDILQSNNMLLPTTAEEDAILPIIRDDGDKQAIFLINTGKPSKPDWHNKVGDGPLYQEIESTNPPEKTKNYKLDARSLHLTPELTQYEDLNTGERFKINEAGHLVSVENPEKGIDVSGLYRVLVRRPVVIN
jgi:hypothetical protein